MILALAFLIATWSVTACLIPVKEAMQQPDTWDIYVIEDGCVGKAPSLISEGSCGHQHITERPVVQRG